MINYLSELSQKACILAHQNSYIILLAFGVLIGCTVVAGIHLMMLRMQNAQMEAMVKAIMKVVEQKSSLSSANPIPQKKKDEFKAVGGFRCWNVTCSCSDGETYTVGVMAKNEVDAMMSAEKSLVEGKHVVEPIVIRIEETDAI